MNKMEVIKLIKTTNENSWKNWPDGIDAENVEAVKNAAAIAIYNALVKAGQILDAK